MATSNSTGSVSSATSRSQAARRFWDDISAFLLADERHLEMFKCNACDDIMVDVVVITKCQHGCCASCIEEHIFEDGVHQCPRCEIELGDNPREYLWKDEFTSDLIEYVTQYHEIMRPFLVPASPPEPTTVAAPPAEQNVPGSDAANGGSNA